MIRWCGSCVMHHDDSEMCPCEAKSTSKCPQCGGSVYAGSDHLCRFQFQPNLRDQFAMAALTGILAEPIEGIIDFAMDARQAYRWADAMLEARKLKPEGK